MVASGEFEGGMVVSVRFEGEIYLCVSKFQFYEQ
jgi:hypothetical protein